MTDPRAARMRYEFFVHDGVSEDNRKPPVYPTGTEVEVVATYVFNRKTGHLEIKKGPEKT